ncbi:MAG: transcription antitermination factor NusB [Granulosicoccus sp.]
MKNIPLATDADTDVPAEELPLLPGTEEPRSLGDLMREAEAASAGPDSTSDVRQDANQAVRPRKSRKPSRSQARRFARERVLQALYQWDVSNAQSSTIRQEFIDNQDMSRVDVDYFLLVFNGVSHSPQVLDDTLLDCLDRPMADLDPIERSVLRIAAFELREQQDIPARVVINEGIEITKRFGADKGHRYVNGVLDKLAMSLRPLEMRSR